MDWAPLHLGHPHASKKTLHLSDMDVHVFGLDEIKGSELPVAIIVSERQPTRISIAVFVS